jgi:SWIM zinc finger
MKISIKNFEKNISKAFLTTGKNYFDTNKVREFDEESIGNFVAFVDDGTESYDVNIVLDDKQNITKHSCDCKEEYLYCAHQIAVLYQLQLGAKSTAIKIPKAKKKTSSELLLETLSQEAIITFLSEAFANDKILELKFVQHFASADVKISLVDAQKNLDIARKTIVKAKKKIEKSELTQIVNLCNPILQNFLKQTNADITIANIKDYSELINYYDTMLNTFNINSNLPEKTIEKISVEKFNFIDKVSEPALKDAIKLVTIQSIFTDGGYKYKQLKAFVAYLNTLPNEEIISLLHLLKLEIRNESSSAKGFANLQEYILPIVAKKELFIHFKTDFITELNNNTYNQLLIEELMLINEWQMAETYCLKIISTNYQDQFNIFYCKKLVEIYTAQNKKEKVLTYKMKICIAQPVYEDYEYVVANLQSPEVKKDFLKQMNATISRNSHDLDYDLFYSKVLVEQGNFSLLFNRLENTNTLLHFINCFTPLFKNNPKKLLQILLARQKPYSWHIRKEEHKDENYYNEICDLVMNNYSPQLFLDVYKENLKKNKVFDLGVMLRDLMITNN